MAWEGGITTLTQRFSGVLRVFQVCRVFRVASCSFVYLCQVRILRAQVRRRKRKGIEVSYRGGPEVQQRYESGDLVRTWRRLMCHALAEVVVLDFGGAEVWRGVEARRRTSNERMGDLVDI